MSFPTPETCEVIYSKVEQETKIPLHCLTLYYNGTIIPFRGSTKDIPFTDTCKVRLVLPMKVTITELLPNEGTCLGGNEITIKGHFPYSGRKYKVNFGVIHTYATYINTNEIHVKTPPHDPGVVNVNVCYEGGENSNNLLFTFTRLTSYNRKYARCADVPTYQIDSENPVDFK